MHSDDQEALDRHRHFVYGEYLRGFAGATTIAVSTDSRLTCEGLAAFVLGQVDKKESGLPKKAREIMGIVREMCEE